MIRKPHSTTDGIVISYTERPNGNLFPVVAKVLLKILSQVTALTNLMDENDLISRKLNDRICLWPDQQQLQEYESCWHKLPYLHLFLLRHDEQEEQLDNVCTWLGKVQGIAGHCVVVVNPESSSSKLAEMASSAWRGRKQGNSSSKFMANLEKLHANVIELQGVKREGAETPSFRRRGAENLAAVMARELSFGFRQRIGRYKEHLAAMESRRDERYIEAVEGLALVYSKLSMFQSALLLYDNLEMVLDQSEHIGKVKVRCLNCGLWYLLADNVDGCCNYHPGKYSYGMSKFDLPKWVCCHATSATAPPCRSSMHQEDTTSSRFSMGVTKAKSLPNFKPALISPSATILDAHAPLAMSMDDISSLKQHLLARQCRLLANMGQYARLGRRVLRFVQMVFRSRSSKGGDALEVEGFAYRICLEASKLFQGNDNPMNVLQHKRGDVGSAAEIHHSSVSFYTVLARLYRMMRTCLTQIGLSWYRPNFGVTHEVGLNHYMRHELDWSEMMEEMSNESESSAGGRESLANSSVEFSPISAAQSRYSLRNSYIQSMDNALEDDWFVDSDSELETPPNRFEQVVSPLVTECRSFSSVLRSVDMFMDALRRIAAKEILAWKRAEKIRNEMAVNTEFGFILFDFGRYEDAYLLLRSVYHRYGSSGWNELFVKCLLAIAECELRLGLRSACISSCLEVASHTSKVLSLETRQRYAERVLKFASVADSRAVMKQLEPHFVVKLKCDQEGRLFRFGEIVPIVARVMCGSWPSLAVTLSNLVVELVCCSPACEEEMEKISLVLGKEVRLTSQQSTVVLGPFDVVAQHVGTYRLKKISCVIGTSLNLIQFNEEQDELFKIVEVSTQQMTTSVPRHVRSSSSNSSATPSKLLDFASPMDKLSPITVLDFETAPLRLNLICCSLMEETTIWATCIGLSLIDNRKFCAISPEAHVAGVALSSTLECSLREDDAVNIVGPLRENDKVKLTIPVKANLLRKRGGEGPHRIELIFACRSTVGGPARATFLPVSIQVVEPWKHKYIVLRSGLFWFISVELQCCSNNLSLMIRSTELVLPEGLALISSNIQYEAVVCGGKSFVLRYCLSAVPVKYDDSSEGNRMSSSNLRSFLQPVFQMKFSEQTDGRLLQYETQIDLHCSVDHITWTKSLLQGLLEDISKAKNTVDLSTNFNLGAVGGKLIAESLVSGCANISCLNLENCRIGSDGAVALSMVLSKLPFLAFLNLFGNHIKVDGIVALCVAAKYCLNGIEEIDWGRNDLSDQTAIAALSALVASSTQLRVLRLWSVGLTTLGVELLCASLKQSNTVEELELGENRLVFSAFQFIATWLTTDPKLCYLSVWYNAGGNDSARVLASALCTNFTLKTLDFRDNNLTDEVAESFAEMLRINKSLIELRLQDNQIGEEGILTLSQAMHQNYVMENLTVVDNVAEAVPSLPFIERIAHGVRRNKSFKSQVLNRASSTDFIASGSGLTHVPPQVCAKSAEHLTSLALENNEIVKLADSLRFLTALTMLNVANNKLESVGEEIEKLTSLKTLRLDGNLLSELSAIHIKTLVNLHTLDLASNRFVQFPECVTILPRLEKLSLARNLMVNFPGHCALRLTALQTLDLSFNRLHSVPAEARKMTALRVLHLDSNFLETLPVCLARMQWDSFRVNDNPFSCIPQSTVAKGSRSILYYLRDLLSGGDYCYRVKLLVTGQANVGKTSLLLALKNEIGNMNKVLRLFTGKGRRSSTTGITLDDWKPLDSLITFSTWDFGGQLVYYATHQFFLSKRSLYVLVFSMATGLQHNRLLSWLNSIQSRAPGVPVMLVGTHLDDKKRCSPSHIADLAASVRRTLVSWERSFAQSERLVILKYTEDCWFFPVSAISGEGVATVRSKLMNVAADQPSLRERVPRLYLQLLDVVRMHRRTENIPITTWAQVREWSGFEDESQLERAVQLLHDWGELLWFSESSSLRDVVVLSPQWLTRMFATIISSTVDDEIRNELSPYSSSAEEVSHDYSMDEEVQMTTEVIKRTTGSRGIIERSDLPLIWSEYDPSHYSYFEKLLETFELWIPLEGGKRFLVPCLLPLRGTEEDCGLEWEQVKFGRCFWCPFPLHGLFERCIVQLHRLYVPRKNWQGEALMEGEEGLKILARMTPFPLPNHPHGQRLLFYFASSCEDKSKHHILRNGVSSVMFVVHNFLMDWYNASLRDEVRAEAFCPKCCSAEFISSFDLESILHNHADGVDASKVCPKCDTTLKLMDDLVPEMTDPVHARSDYSQEMEELLHVADGSCSRVFKCLWRSKRNPEEEKTVAVKKLRVRTITTTWFVEFLQEISILQQLRHKNIVSIEAAYLRPLCIVLEWIGGGTLDQALKEFEGPHHWELLIQILQEISSGMLYLHSLAVPIFHRDLKSLNILVVDLKLGADPCVKIADLGSSCRSLGKVSGNVVHNPRWKPPELFVNSANYTAASDVYCFGLIMYELVKRDIPFAELVWPSLIEDKILLGERPSLEGVGELRMDYERLMKLCWSQYPEERPTSDQVFGLIEGIRSKL